MTIEQETLTESAITETEPQAPTPASPIAELDEVKQATQNLVDALKKLAEATMRSATTLTQEANQNIEQSVQDLRQQADQNWQTAIKDVKDIDTRLAKAAKAAWEVLTTPTSSDSEPKE